MAILSKRLLSFMLAVVMVFTLVPVSVFASEDDVIDDEPGSAASDSEDTSEEEPGDDTDDIDDDEEAPPAEGEDDPPAEGEDAHPSEGEDDPPVEGEEAPPAEGEEVPPVDGVTVPPVDGVVAPPATSGEDQDKDKGDYSVTLDLAYDDYIVSFSVSPEEGKEELTLFEAISRAYENGEIDEDEYDDIMAPEHPEGYDFEGWKDMDGNTVRSGDEIENEVELQAQWDGPEEAAEPFVVELYYNTPGARQARMLRSAPQPNETLESEDGTPVTLPDLGTVNGWKHVGWQDAESGNEYDIGDEVTEALSLTALWVPTVKFEPDNEETATVVETELDEDSGAYYIAGDAPEAPAKEGYTFGGWYDGETAFNAGAALVNPVTYTARWISNVPEVKYEVEFDFNDGETAPVTVEAPEGYTVAAALDLLPDVDLDLTPSRTGYIFGGWMLGEDEFDLSSAINESITLVAAWTETHTVSFVYEDGAELYAPVTVADGATAAKPANPTPPSGYVGFTGWFQQSGTSISGDNFNFSTPITEDVTLVAIFSQTVHAYFVMSDNETAPYQFDLIPGESFRAPDETPAPPLEGHSVFSHWYLDGPDADPAQAAVFPFTALDTDMVFKPYFSDSAHVFFIAPESTDKDHVYAERNIEVLLGQSVNEFYTEQGKTFSTEMPNPGRFGYTFGYWSLSPDGAAEDDEADKFDLDTAIEENTILYAAWKPVTVNYKVAIWMEKANMRGGAEAPLGPGAAAYVPTVGNNAEYSMVPVTETNPYVTMQAYAGTPVDEALAAIIKDTQSIKNLFTTGNFGILKYATYQGVDTSANQVISGDGNTIVNLYATRTVYTYNFTFGSGTLRIPRVGGADYYGSYLMTAKYEEDTSLKFPAVGKDDDLYTLSFGIQSWGVGTAGPPNMSSTTQRVSFSKYLTKGEISSDGQTRIYNFYANDDPGNGNRFIRVFEKKPDYTGAVTINSGGTDYVIDDIYTETIPTTRDNLRQRVLDGYISVKSNGNVWGAGDTTKATTYYYHDGQYLTADQMEDHIDANDGWGQPHRGQNLSSFSNDRVYAFFYKRDSFTLQYDWNRPDSAADVQNFTNIKYEELLDGKEPTQAQIDAKEASMQNTLGSSIYFDDWYTDDSFTTVFDPTGKRMPNGGMVVVGRWLSNANTVTFYSNPGEDELGRQGLGKGETVNWAQAPYGGEFEPDYADEDHGEFAGWYYYSGGQMIKFAESTFVHKNYDLYPKWNTKGFKVSYYLNADDEAPAFSNSLSYALGDKDARILDCPADAAPEGYEFDAWQDEDGNIYYAGSTIPVMFQNVKLTAVYKPSGKEYDYKILYKADYGLNRVVEKGFDDPAKVNLHGYQQFTRQGYDLMGWSLTSADPDDLDEPYFTPWQPNIDFRDDIVNNTVTLYAVWRPRAQVTVIYDANDDDIGDPNQGENDTVIDGPEDKGYLFAIKSGNIFVAPDGYEFVNWKTADGRTYTGGNWRFDNEPNNTVTLYAQWRANKFWVTYDGNGATGGNAPAGTPSQETRNSTVHVKTNDGNFVKTGYTFKGWNTKADGTGTAYSADGAARFTMPAADVTLYAVWEINPYTLSYNGNGNTGGTAPASVTRDYNTEVTISDEGTLERTGYTFTGWATTAGGDVAYEADDPYTILGDATLYAVWDQDEYTVTYAPGDYGTFTAQVTTGLVYGATTPTAPSTPGEPGYTFTGWNPVVTDTVTGTVMYVAQWIPNIVVTLVDRTEIYDGTAYGLFEAVSAPAGATLTYAYNEEEYDSMPTFVNVGTYDITVTASLANYADATAEATLTINPRPITLRADDKSMVSNQAIPAFTYTFGSGGTGGTPFVPASTASPFAPGDDVGSLELTFAPNPLVTDYGPGVAAPYRISWVENAVSWNNDNYTITVMPGVLTVTTPPVTDNDVDDDDRDPNYDNGDGGGGGGDGGGTATTTTINDNAVPLANLPLTDGLTTIMDSEIPLASLPRTGGSSRRASVVLSGLLAALAAFAARAKSEKEEDEAE